MGEYNSETIMWKVFIHINIIANYYVVTVY